VNEEPAGLARRAHDGPCGRHSGAFDSSRGKKFEHEYMGQRRQRHKAFAADGQELGTALRSNGKGLRSNGNGFEARVNSESFKKSFYFQRATRKKVDKGVLGCLCCKSGTLCIIAPRLLHGCRVK
jgi:hypothetical protein